MTRRQWIMPSWLVTVIVASAAVAQDPPVDLALEDMTAPPRLEVSVKTGVWIPRLGGEVALGPNADNPITSLEDQFTLNDSEFAVNVEMKLRFDDRWYIRASGFDFSTDTSGVFRGNATFGSVTLNDGDAFTAGVDMTSVSIEAGLDLSRPFPDARYPEAPRASARVSGVAGVRYLGVDQDVTRLAGGSASGSGDWLAIYVGADIQLRWAADAARPRGRGIMVDGGVAVGVDAAEGGLFVQVRAGLVFGITDNIGFEFGYRLLEVDFQDDAYGFDAGLQGLFVGGVVRF